MENSAQRTAPNSPSSGTPRTHNSSLTVTAGRHDATNSTSSLGADPRVVTNSFPTPSPPTNPKNSTPNDTADPNQLAGKKSKLTLLASSRASTVMRSSAALTSRSSEPATFPELRPAAESERGISSSTASGVTPPASSPRRVPTAPASSSSSTSSHVRRAIGVALNQEYHDQVANAQDGGSSQNRYQDQPTSPKGSHSVASAPSESGSTTPKARQPAPLPPYSPRSAQSPEDVAEVPNERRLSKLAEKAQASQGQWMPKKGKQLTRSQVPPGLLLPEPRTEFMTPTANGPTATVAITTSYQSLYSLATSSRRETKLAMKMKKANERSEHESRPEEPGPVPTSPLFLPQTSDNRASPSAFASLLIDHPLNPAKGRQREQKSSVPHPSASSPRSTALSSRSLVS
jgi:hypothetical protein